MNYEIIAYRTSQRFRSIWSVDVKIKISFRFLWLFRLSKVRWVSCGMDGHPRIYQKEMEIYIPNNRLLVFTTFREAHEAAEELTRKNKLNSRKSHCIK